MKKTVNYFQIIKDLINKTAVGKSFTRKTLYAGHYTWNGQVLDNYRRKLEVLGYIKGNGRGTYTVLYHLSHFYNTTKLIKDLQRHRIRKLANEFPCQYKEGFTNVELKKILEHFPNINKKQFYNALTGVTGTMKDNKCLTYRTDIEKALVCGMEKRELYSHEWD